MTSKPIMRLSLALLCAGALSSSLLYAKGSLKKDFDDTIIEGESRHIQKRVMSSAQLASAMKKAKNRILPACPPAPPASVVGVPVGQVGIPVTFYPNNSVANSLTPPPQTIGATFTVHSQAINALYIGTPPGPMGVVGPQQFISCSDQRLASFDKQGNLDGFLDIDQQSFPDADGDFSYLQDFDWAHMRYDTFSDRFYYVKELYNDIGDRNDSSFTMAVSDSGIISNATKWTVVDIYNHSVLPDSTGCPGDQGFLFNQAQIGIDQHALYIGQIGMFYNFSDPNGGAFGACTAFVVQKESLLKDGPVVINVFRDLFGFPGDELPTRISSGALTGVDNFDANPEFGYFVATDPLNFGRLQFFRVINPGSTTPTLSAAIPLVVPNTSTGFAVPINWNGNLWGPIGVLSCEADDTMPHAHIRNKQLYTIQTMAFDANGLADLAGDRVGARWYQIDLTGNSAGTGTGTETETTVPALVQAGTLWDPAVSDPLNYFINSIMTNARGDLVISGTIANTATTPSAFVVGRLASDTLGTLRVGANKKGIIYAAGSGSFSRTLGAAFNDGQPWGPYSNVSLDPADSMTMWTIQEIVRDGMETMVVAELIAP